MLPTKASHPIRNVRTFEVTTPAGRFFRFPRPTLLQRLLSLILSNAETAIVAAVVMSMIYSAGFLAEAIEPLSSNNCRN